MLERIPEPELMDTPEEAHAHDAMDHREVNRRFVTDLLAVIAVHGWSSQLVDRQILDLGTGTALIPIELCRRKESIHVLAVDAAVHMLHLAAKNVADAKLAARIELQLADVKDLRYSVDQLSIVMSNCVVHHVAEPAKDSASTRRPPVPLPIGIGLGSRRNGRQRRGRKSAKISNGWNSDALFLEGKTVEITRTPKASRRQEARG